MTLSEATIGILIIVIPMICGVFFCIGVCIILSIRYKIDALPTPWSKFVFRQRYLNPHDLPSPNQTSPSEILVFPTISWSETGSEPCSPMSNVSTSSPLTRYDRRDFRTFPASSEKRGSAVEGGVASALDSLHRLFDSKTLNPKEEYGSNVLQNVAKAKERPSFLPLWGPLVSSTVSSGAPSSESGTSTSPAEFESLRMHFRHRSHDERFLHPSVLDGAQTPDTAMLRLVKTDQKHKFKIGSVKVKIQYICSNHTFEINLLSGYHLPYHIHCKHSDLYAKFSLTIGNSRSRSSKALASVSPQSDEDKVIATFQYTATAQELSQASVVITFCKKLQTLDQGMVIGSAFVNIGSLSLSESKDFDSGTLELPLEDCNPHQMMFCGGYLQCSIDIPAKASHVSLTNIQLSGMDLNKIFGQEEGSQKEYVQLYLKITIYEEGEAVFWRRTTPVIVTPNCQVLPLASQVLLEVTPKKLSTMQLVLSVRLKTGKRGERCILGNIYLSESWFKNEVAVRKESKGYSSNTILHLPLDF